MTEADWDRLLRRIRDGDCTPFLGAGTGLPTLPLGKEIAARWAEKYGYPLSDRDDLAAVAQYIAVNEDPMYPKELLRDELRGKGQPDFNAAGEPHAALASLKLPIYITTNYDNFMLEALRNAQTEPVMDFCRWNRSQAVIAQPSVLGDRRFSPTSSRPVVFYLHGHLELLESIVLTEDDYFAFLAALSSNQRLLPHLIRRALGSTSLLFIGYRLADWSFRVIHHGLVVTGDPSLRRLSLTVQVAPTDDEERELAEAQRYLESYFGELKVKVYWGTANAFMNELMERWEATRDG